MYAIRSYYDNDVTRTMGGIDKTRDFFRLFMVPDCGMCPAMSPGTFDALGAVEKWVEEGIAPDQIKTTYFRITSYNVCYTKLLRLTPSSVSQASITALCMAGYFAGGI